MAFEREKVQVLISTSVRGLYIFEKGGRLTGFVDNVTRGFVPITDVRI